MSVLSSTIAYGQILTAASFTEPGTTVTSSQGEDLTTGIKIEEIQDQQVDYTYTAMDKGNPFIPPIIPNKVSPLETPVVSILQKYRLDQLQVVGVWSQQDAQQNILYKALVMTEQDEGVTVRIGDPIGNQGGQILHIEPTKIIVREFTLMPDGSRQFEDFDILLGKDATNHSVEGAPSSANPIHKPFTPLPGAAAGEKDTEENTK